MWTLTLVNKTKIALLVSFKAKTFVCLIAAVRLLSKETTDYRAAADRGK